MRSFALTFGLLLSAIGLDRSARPPVDLVLLADSSPAVAHSAQHWIAMFSKLGVDGVQIRSARQGETIGIEDVRHAGRPELPCHGPIDRRHRTGAARRPLRTDR